VELGVARQERMCAECAMAMAKRNAAAVALGLLGVVKGGEGAAAKRGSDDKKATNVFRCLGGL
jgi:hypothetical protein